MGQMTVRYVYEKGISLTGSGAASTLKTGLISWFELDDTGWGDSHGSNTLTGNGSPTVVPALVGNGVSLATATPQWLSCASNSSLQVGGTDFSVAVRFRSSAFQGDSVLVSKHGGFGNSEYALDLNFGSNFQARMTVFDTGGSQESVNASTFGALSTNTNYLAVATYNDTTKEVTISVNAGTRNTLTTTKNIVAKTGPFNIGNRNNDATPTGFGYNGIIDQVIFWKKVVSATEEGQLHNGGAGLPYSAA